VYPRVICVAAPRLALLDQRESFDHVARSGTPFGSRRSSLSWEL